MYRLFALILLVAGCKTSSTITNQPSFDSQTPMEENGIALFTSGMPKYSGYFPFYYEDETGRIYLEVDKINSEFLYINSLAAGIGSNDIGLDRGQLGRERIVKFVHHGPKLLLIQPNYDYRAISDNPNETKSVEEAFARSVLAGFDILVRDEWSYLIDFTDFLLSDAHGIAKRLSQTNQGNYQLDRNRSVIYMDETYNFPENTEFETLITFDGNPTGSWIRSVTPSPEAVSVRMHHSLVQLPDSGYTPRKFDPRGGFFSISYQDYATPIDQPLIKRYIARHRLIKKDPEADRSEAVDPIIYYLDPGAPEPVRSALLEGASWWNEAFESAGFINAFRVEILPEDVHPLDVRYNVIQWVHRSTRGWSYGASVVDPRTGEIIKGHVSLGSLRVRQDFLIATGLLSPFDESEDTEVMKELALARLRQLSAHEVGHTLGLAHNYAASKNNRASVMDYPHPYVKITNGTIDLSDAYDTGIGEWDKTAIQYGYSAFNNSQEEPGAILEKAIESGQLFITDRDARAMGGAHPVAHLWDNGEDAADELNRVLDIRKIALQNISENTIRKGEPYSSIEEVLVPIYLFHRYQVDAASKLVGGLDYTYKLKGDNQISSNFLPASIQKKAVKALIRSISPEELALSDELLMLIPPKAFGTSRSRETFVSNTGPTFDYYAAIQSAIDLTLSFLLHDERANRLIQYKSIDATQPGFSFVLDELIQSFFKSGKSAERELAIQRQVQSKLIQYLFQLYKNDDVYSDVKAITRLKLLEIQKTVDDQKSRNQSIRAHNQMLSYTISSFLEDPYEFDVEKAIQIPDGSPIGSDYHYCSEN